jgi:hypothetical protein
MALIKCKECGIEVSEKAAACVKCGAPLEQESLAIKFFAGCIMVAMGMGILYGILKLIQPNAPDDATNPVEVAIKPDSIYTTLPGNITCPTEDLLLEAVQHANAGEKTLFSQTLLQNGGMCMEFPAGVKVRVLHVDNNRSPDHAIIRFGLLDAPNADGMWAIDRLIRK